jgi:predicted ATP-dependent endonuclease of OLD family
MSLVDLLPDTKEFFMKLPGYNTLRLILSAKTILVEGPSDELIVQKAYMKKHGKLPLEDGVDVISVGTSFKRFLDIGKLLKLNIRVVTDNDGSIRKLKDKYKDYLDGNEIQNIKICYDNDEKCKTLEPQLLKANSLKMLNKVLGTTFGSDEALLTYMCDDKNKTDSALKIFNSAENLTFPEYINNAIE